MITKYYSNERNRFAEVYVGEAAEISAMYKALCRASEKQVTEYFPSFVDMPKYNPEKIYGIEVEVNGCFTIISEHVVAYLFKEEIITKA